MTKSQTYVLALLAAEGILGHNTAVDMPGSFTLGQLSSLSNGWSEEDLEIILDWHTRAGHVNRWNTGYNGYGGHHVEGSNTYRVTSKGLIALWMGAF